MNSKLLRTSSVVVVLVLVGLLVQPFGRDAAAQSNREGRLQGTWRVQVNPRNCQTGAPIPSFSVLLSFARGGTLTEVMNAQALLPGQRTTGLRSEEHTSELQSHLNLVCRLLLEKKKKKNQSVKKYKEKKKNKK